MPEPAQPIERKLAAIFAADVAGYSRLMGQDEVGTMRTLTARREVMDQLIAQHRGRIANTAGDSVLAEFPSVVDAVQCAVEVQEALREKNEGVPEDRQLRFRIAVHVGDVMVRDGDLLGDGVNVAARLQTLAEPGGVCISGDAYQYAHRCLPLTFTDLGQQAIKNVREGVRAYFVRLREHDSDRPLSLPDKPSIAVLPFTNMSGDPEQEPFADGIVEEIIAALSRVRSFFVISRNSSFTYKGRAVDPRRVGREVGVRYVLEGSVRKSGSRVRIMAQLIDATAGSHIWGERYDGEVADIFDLQDRVTEAVVGAIEPTIALSEIERIKRKRPENLDAYECAMRALPAVWAQDPETTSEGLRLAQRAMVLDPAYALPKALAAWCHSQRIAYMRTTDLAEDRARAVELAREAVRLESNDPLVLTLAGAAYTLVREYRTAGLLLQKALTLDPNSAWGWARSGWLHVYLQQPDVAIQHFNRAMRLSPLDPMNFNVLFGIGGAHNVKREDEEAIPWLERGLEQKPDASWGYRALAASYAHTGRLEEAKRAVAILREAYPGLTISTVLAHTPVTGEHSRRFSEGLRKAGLPE